MLEKNVVKTGIEVLNLQEGVEISLPDPWKKTVPLLPEKVENSFPVPVHKFISGKGKIIDSGWMIKWFTDEETASEQREKARLELESIELTKNFFHELKSGESKFREIIIPEIDIKATHEEIFNYADISNVKFTGRISSSTEVSLDSYRHADRPGTTFTEYFQYKKQHDGSLLVATMESDYKAYTMKHFYNIALEVGANKTSLDQNLINHYNSQLDQLVENIKQQYDAETVKSLKDGIRNLLPKKSGSHINFEDPLYNLESIISGKEKISTIEKYWEKEDSFLPMIKGFNLEIKKWNELWKGAFDEVAEKNAEGKIIINFGGHFRSGATGSEQYWVLRPNGDMRPATSCDYRKGYFSEGDKFWDVVLEDELALYWSKVNTAAGHNFIIMKKSGTLTGEQVSTMQKIVKSISEEWKDVTGISGKSSPKINESWLTQLNHLEGDYTYKPEVLKEGDLDNQAETSGIESNSSESEIDGELLTKLLPAFSGDEENTIRFIREIQKLPKNGAPEDFKTNFMAQIKEKFREGMLVDKLFQTGRYDSDVVIPKGILKNDTILNFIFNWYCKEDN